MKTDRLECRWEGLKFFDEQWQFPCITEKKAFELARFIKIPPPVTYIGFPWATLIDKMENKASDAGILLDALDHISREMEFGSVGVTVCQHILFGKYKHLFVKARVKHVFHSHAVNFRNGLFDFTMPFPLYPVQLAEQSAIRPATRQHLFSFIGARAESWYLTRVRNWIIDFLSEDPRGLVIGRNAWHYNKIVYDHQIQKRATSLDGLVDHAASKQFKQVLWDSIFSLCPSGSGPNSIRLWESIGAGAIPVILADTWLPPGNRALWEAAAVFCPETPEDVKALPYRLAAIAADPAELARKRHAMHQLWMLYGPDHFIYDIQKFVIEKATEHAAQQTSRVTPGAIPAPHTVRHLAETITASDPPSRVTSAVLISACANQRLLDPSGGSAAWSDAADIARATERALATLGPEHPLAKNLARIKARDAEGAQLSVAVVRRPRVFLFGRHANRIPLSYSPYRTLAEPVLEFVKRPEEADLIVAGFSNDFADNIDMVRALLARKPDLRLVVLSEEPLWDTMWSGGYTQNLVSREVRGAPLAYKVLSHFTSDIYRFKRIPYFVTTSDDYIARYIALFERNKTLAPKALLESWAKAPIRKAFFAEKRDGAEHDLNNPTHDVVGLSCYRTRVTEASRGEGVLIAGKGWGDAGPRQALPDWHLDKLATLDRQSFIVSGIENTHQRDYISEKFFDAYAVQGVPVYVASPRHRIGELIPQDTFLNVYGQSPGVAAETLNAFKPDLLFAERYLESQKALHDLFSDIEAIVAERVRVTQAITRALTETLENRTHELVPVMSAAQ